MRLLAVSAIVVVLAIGYLILLRHFNVSELPGERHFGATEAVKAAGEVYIEPISIDALNDAMQVRAYLEPSVSLGSQDHSASDRDLTLVITHDNTVEEVKLAANEHLVTGIFEVDLNEGTVAHYPLDSYRANLGVQLFEGRPDSVKLPARVTVWEGVLGFNLHTTGRSGPGPNQTLLTIDITRSGAFALFALAAYAAMVVLGCCAFVIGLLTFTDVRRPEATLIGALAAIAFALPVLRSALPGAPPLGIQADIFVFLWTELAAVIALGLLVFKWAQSGPRP
jgi:hypothetical protein